MGPVGVSGGDPLVVRWEPLGTSTISDALDRLGVAGQCAGIAPIYPSARLVGRAFTVRYGPAAIKAGTVGDYIDDLGPGDVVVLDNQGRSDVTVWGDLLTATACQRTVAGTVIDGVCRDADRSVELGYPVFARGRYMRTGKDRVQVEAYQGPVSVGGARVEAGDLVIGDGDGVVIVPAALADELYEVAHRIGEAEDRIRQAVAGGASLREARAAEGYHGLQTRLPEGER